MAAYALIHALEAYENDPSVTFNDMLRCLDYGGTIAEIGARCLYVRTSRNGEGWTGAGSKGLPCSMRRADWEDYLRRHDLI